MQYQASYAHSENDSTGRMALDATTDAEAVAEVREFVEDGYRNGTWAAVTLSDGRRYRVENRHGDAMGYYV